MKIVNTTKRYTTEERKKINSVINECITHCDDLEIIFYLQKQTYYPKVKCSYPFVPAMEFLVITKSKESAHYLWEKTRYPNSLTASYLLAKEKVTNLIIISDEEICDVFEGMESFYERLMKSSIVWER